MGRGACQFPAITLIMLDMLVCRAADEDDGSLKMTNIHISKLLPCL